MSSTTRFSVITPTHRRPHSLLRMLDALASQDYPHDRFEAIVVLDGADEGVTSLLQARKFPYRLRAVTQAKSGPAAARNRGLDEATEPFVLFLDDDVVPSASLMRHHADSHRDEHVVVIGPLLPAAAARPAPWTQWEWATVQEQYRAMAAGEWAPTPRQFYTGNASVRTDDVKAVGGFNPEFKRGEDVELAWRLHERGMHFVFNPLAKAEHFAERSFAAWLTAAHEYGRSDIMLERIRGGQNLPGWVGHEYPTRHRYTRFLAKAVLAHPELWHPIANGGHVAAWAAGKVGWGTAAGRLCSALFTTAYWRGVGEQLGRSHTLGLLADVEARARARTAA